jgi:hypothetical protein
MMKKVLLFVLLIGAFADAKAQMSFKDTILEYNRLRINTNVRGAKALGVWGIANVAAGTIGYFAAGKDEWKSFHAMNAGFGLLNTGISTVALIRARKQMREQFHYRLFYERYLTNKTSHLIDAGIDVLLIAGGTVMSTKTGPDAAYYKGFGTSIAIQGIVQLLFDNVMFYSHAKYNSHWYRIMDEIQISGSGIRLNWTF